jgi:hypothetical protein
MKTKFAEQQGVKVKDGVFSEDEINAGSLTDGYIIKISNGYYTIRGFMSDGKNHLTGTFSEDQLEIL